MKKTVHTDRAPKAVGPYSQAVSIGNIVFTSGQIPINPDTGKLVEGDIKRHTRQVMENLKAVLEACGTDFSKVIKATIYLDDIKDFAKMNEVYGEYFSSDMPARSAFEVASLPLEAKVEIEMIAYL
ncbi:MAG: RidA family protein [Thermodesulfobacteriota bacterium]|nr:RidA family protein [Thermodesulfobacteriota bacterium]